MVKRQARGAAAITAAALFVLSACSGGSMGRLVPSGGPNIAMVDAKATPPPPVQVASIAWGKLPAGTAGTAFAKPVKLTLTAKNKKGKAIKGTYANPITISDDDKSGATKLFVNGKAASTKNQVKKSSDVVTLSYTGLAISPVTFSASAKKVKKPATASFAPTVAAIVYTGPTVNSAAEVDLYSTTPNTTGFSGSFTATQAGWTEAAYNQPFTQSFGAVSGQTNNCPGQTNSPYSITPASGIVAGPTGFTVSVNTAAQQSNTPSNFVGYCSMTLTGGAGKTQVVTLTFTTSGIGINGKHAQR